MTVVAFVRRLPPPLRGAVERWLETPAGARLARGVVWSFAGLVASRGMTLAANVVAARLLGKVGLGELDMVLQTVSFLGVFAGMGLGTAATREVARFRVDAPSRVGRTVALAIVSAGLTGAAMAAALFLGAPWLARELLAAPHLGEPLRLAAPLLFLGALTGVQGGVLAGFESFRTTTVVATASAVLYVPLMVAGVWWAGVEGAVVASIASFVVTGLLHHVALRRRLAREGTSLSARGCLAEMPGLVAIGLPAFLSAALVAPVDWVVRAILVNSPAGYAELGAYNVANQWYAVVMFAPMVLGQPLLPVLTESWARHGAAECRRTLVLAMRTTAVVVLPVVVAAGLASPWIVRLYGPAFRDEWLPLAVMLVTAGAVAVQWPVGLFLTAAGRLWHGVLMNVCWALVYLGATFLLVDRGATGVAVARLVAYAFLFVWSAAIVLRLPKDGA